MNSDEKFTSDFLFFINLVIPCYFICLVSLSLLIFLPNLLGAS